MKKSILEFYALAICFISALFFIVVFSVGAYHSLAILAPSFTLSSYEYAQYESNEAYEQAHPQASSEKNPKKRSDAEITKLRTDGFQSALKNEQRQGWQILVKSLIMLFVIVPVYISHWFIARRARNTTA